MRLNLKLFLPLVFSLLESGSVGIIQYIVDGLAVLC